MCFSVLGNWLKGVVFLWLTVFGLSDRTLLLMGLCALSPVWMSESSMSMNSSASEWGDDPLVSVGGVRATVLGGRPVWPLALHRLLTVIDRMPYLERRLAHVDFTLLPLGARSAGAIFVESVSGGHDVDWADRRIAPDQADRVLAALGLLHMRVRCVQAEGGWDRVPSSWESD
jgi:hypothetical protein